MKNLIACLVVILLIGATIWVWAGTPIPGTIVAAKITTGNTDNTFSIGDTIEMLGTCKQVADLTARDAIPAERRAEGMQCWVVSTGLSYRLIGGIANGNWQVTPPVGLPPNALGDLHNDGIGNLSWVPVQGVWSNYQGFIFPAGEPAPDTNGTLRGPSVFFAPNGGQFGGTNVNQDAAAVMRSFTQVQAPYYVTMVDSNEAPIIAGVYRIIDSENYGFNTSDEWTYIGNKDSGNIDRRWSVLTTNGNFSKFEILLDPNSANVITFETAGQDITLNNDATITANGFIDNSGTPGSLVAYQGGNRLGATNATFVTVINTTYFTNQLSYITNLFATYITNNLAYITNLFSSYATNNTSYITNLNVFTTVNNFASNYIAGVETMATNANNTTPDFAVMGSTLSTNNNFKWLPPIHLDTTGKAEQWIITHITNSSGSLITMTLPDNVHQCGGGALNVTNWTEIRWQYYPPSGPTNAWSSPGY